MFCRLCAAHLPVSPVVPSLGAVALACAAAEMLATAGNWLRRVIYGKDKGRRQPQLCWRHVHHLGERLADPGHGSLDVEDAKLVQKIDLLVMTYACLTQFINTLGMSGWPTTGTRPFVLVF